MNDSFKTREDAEKEVARIKSETLPDFFCPLTITTCNIKCICIGEPRYGIQHPSPPVYYVYGWHCSNAMFTETEIRMS